VFGIVLKTDSTSGVKLEHAQEKDVFDEIMQSMVIFVKGA